MVIYFFQNDGGPAFGTSPRSPRGRGAFEAGGSDFFFILAQESK